jgi:hypothetical protein
MVPAQRPHRRPRQQRRLVRRGQRFQTLRVSSLLQQAALWRRRQPREGSLQQQQQQQQQRAMVRGPQPPRDAVQGHRERWRRRPPP